MKNQNAYRILRKMSADALLQLHTHTHAQLPSKYYSKTLVFYANFCFHGNHSAFNMHHIKIDCETISFVLKGFISAPPPHRENKPDFS